MNEVKERTILQEGLVKVTNLRTIIGTQTYSISKIKSVRVTKQAKSYRPLWLVILGIFLILWAHFDETGGFAVFFGIGTLLIVAAMAIFLAKPSYAVQIGISIGELDILRSSNLSFIQKIATAINHAISQRG